MSAAAARAGGGLPRRLGLNRGYYAGERVDIAHVLRAIRGEAIARGWAVEVFGQASGMDLLGLVRLGSVGASGGVPGWRLYVSAGIHADEPAGVLAVLELLRRDRFPDGAGVWMCPCLNPGGFPFNRRENPLGQDLNRDYRGARTAEVRAHVAWLERQPGYEVAVCLHEDWEAQGFYLYELNPDRRRSAAESVIEAVGGVCPIDLSTRIDGRAAAGGIIRPDLNPAVRPEWPEAFYLVQRKTRHSYTLEAPSDYGMAVRVEALVVGTEALMRVHGRADASKGEEA